MSSALCARMRSDGVDVIDGDHDATYAQRVHRRSTGPSLIALGVWNLSNSMPAHLAKAWPSFDVEEHHDLNVWRLQAPEDIKSHSVRDTPFTLLA